MSVEPPTLAGARRGASPRPPAGQGDGTSAKHEDGPERHRGRVDVEPGVRLGDPGDAHRCQGREDDGHADGSDGGDRGHR